MIRVMTVASSKRSSPDAISQTTTGAAAMPAMQVSTRAPSSTVATASISRRVASSPSAARTRASVGTKACEKAPSPNRRRSRFGMRKATLKASNDAPAPNTEETTMSRNSPETREASVNREIVEAARSRFMGGAEPGHARREPADAILAVFAEIPLVPRTAPHGHRYQSQEEDRPHRLRAEARSAGRQAQCRQHGASLAVPHRDQERAEGGRRRRQGQGRRAVQGRAAGDRLGRRQEHLPQE